MGCGNSSAAEPEPSLPWKDDEEVEFQGATSGNNNEPTPVSDSFNKLVHRRLVKLQELDEKTKVPFILVELTGEASGEGEVEVCGKDEYGIYEALDNYFLSEWNCEKMDPGDLTLETKVPFCALQYRWPGFQCHGSEGLNNMGLMTMRLIDFVCGQLSWTLAVVNGGNVGTMGEVRETQVIFKAPHPMNLVAPHMMIEMRSAGFIEICADLDEEHQGMLDGLDEYFCDRFQAERLDGHENFCDRYYQAGDGVFKGAAGSLDSNFGLLTVDVCDKVVKDFPGWSLVASSAGNYGEAGEHCEQQLVFRRDEHPLGRKSYLLVILNEQGNIEVNGKEVRSTMSHLDKFFRNRWKCERAGHFAEGDTVCRRYTWEAGKDLLSSNAELVTFFEKEGWEIQVCSQQMVKEGGVACKEQQLLFRQGASEVGVVEPHLFIELYAGEGSKELYEDEETTQLLANQNLRLRAIGPPTERKKVQDQLDAFITQYLAGSPGPDMYFLNVFLCRGRFENNLAQWTMRLCDFMVDRLGWSFLVCSLCNMGDCGQFRSQQLLFRFDGDKRELPVSAINLRNLDPSEWVDTPLPDYWHIPQVLDGTQVHKVTVCNAEEIESLRSMCDSTFKRILTRDRQPDEDAPEDMEMPYRLDVVHAFRSENLWLNHRYQIARAGSEFAEGGEEFAVLTGTQETAIGSRLQPGEAFLFHGTNPSSAMSILKTGFVLDHAGSARGTMFGNGIYMAEASSKSDEYGRDDGGNTYPSVNALLVCRCFVGTPWVVQQAGDHVADGKDANADCICGDRASRVGTYREFVFFDEAKIYPEFALIYRRQYDAAEVPQEMVVPTSGTTGRFWQVHASKETGWKNLPTEVNKVLVQAQKDGNQRVEIVWKSTEYIFDVVEKVGTNSKTGNTVRLRPPMQS